MVWALRIALQDGNREEPELNFAALHETVCFGRANGQIIWQPRIGCWYHDKQFAGEPLPEAYEGMEIPEIHRALGCSARLYDDFNLCFRRMEHPAVTFTEKPLNETDIEITITTPVGSQVAVERSTPRPQGDVSIDEIKAGLGDDIFLIDGIPAIYFDATYPVETLTVCVEQLIERFAPKLILGISDEISSTGDIERIRIVGEMVARYNARFADCELSPLIKSPDLKGLTHSHRRCVKGDYKKRKGPQWKLPRPFSVGPDPRP